MGAAPGALPGGRGHVSVPPPPTPSRGTGLTALRRRSRPDLPLTYVDDAADILAAPYVILGATGFGLYQMFDSQAGAFPAFFDWIVLDEASQMLMPQALLSLVYGKGQYIFCGDVQQLPPVVLGPQPAQERAKTALRRRSRASRATGPVDPGASPDDLWPAGTRASQHDLSPEPGAV